MLKDVNYKDITYVFYNQELCIRKRLMPVIKLGSIQVKEESIRRYVVVNPEFYLYAHDGVGISEPLMPDPHVAAKVVCSGSYFINKDLNLITGIDIYECWRDTANEITSFIERSGFLNNLRPKVPNLEQVQNEIDQFVGSLQKP